MIEYSAQNSARETVLPPISSSYNKRSIRFSFVCSPCKQTAPSLFFEPILPVARIAYSTFFCGFGSASFAEHPAFSAEFAAISAYSPPNRKKDRDLSLPFPLIPFLISTRQKNDPDCHRAPVRKMVRSPHNRHRPHGNRPGFRSAPAYSAAFSRTR